jgi:hypothetical protein
VRLLPVLRYQPFPTVRIAELKSIGKNTELSI